MKGNIDVDVDVADSFDVMVHVGIDEMNVISTTYIYIYRASDDVHHCGLIDAEVSGKGHSLDVINTDCLNSVIKQHGGFCQFTTIFNNPKVTLRKRALKGCKVLIWALRVMILVLKVQT